MAGIISVLRLEAKVVEKLLRQLPKGVLITALMALAGLWWKEHNDLVALRERQYVSEHAAEQDRSYTAWLQWKVDQARTKVGLDESGTPPPSSRPAGP